MKTFNTKTPRHEGANNRLGAAAQPARRGFQFPVFSFQHGLSINYPAKSSVPSGLAGKANTLSPNLRKSVQSVKSVDHPSSSLRALPDASGCLTGRRPPDSRAAARVSTNHLRAFVSSCLTSRRSGVTPVSRSAPVSSRAAAPSPRLRAACPDNQAARTVIGIAPGVYPGRAGTVNPSFRRSALKSVQSVKSVDHPSSSLRAFASSCLTRRRSSPRGMILLLVIAILVLLALLGTAYILMARADKHATYAANAAANMGLAQQGVLNILRNTMLNQTLDGASSVLGANYGFWSGTVAYPVGAVVELPPNFSTTYVTTYYQCTTANTNSPPPSADWQQISAARGYDYPQQTTYYASGANPAGSLVWSQAAPYSVYDAVQNDPTTPPVTAASGSTTTPAWQPVQGEDFLVEDLPMEPNTRYIVGQTVLWDTQRYVCTAAGTTSAGPVATPTSQTSPEPGWTLATNGSAQENPFSNLLAQPTSASVQEYDPSDGQYDLTPLLHSAAFASVVQPSVVANNTLNPGSITNPYSTATYPYGTRDAIWEMLPYSSPNGTRYRFAVRIINSNSMLNLNAGSVVGITNPSGQYFNGAQLDGLMVSGDTAANIINGNGTINGRAGSTTGTNYATLKTTSSSFLPAWADELLTYQAPAGAGVQWYSLATELELRSYGNSGGGFNGGTPYYGRPLQLWPNTLGYSITIPYLAAASRAFYTTYSWDRSFRRAHAAPLTFPALSGTTLPLTYNNTGSFTFSGTTQAQTVWPAFPRKINANGPAYFGAANQTAAIQDTAVTATDLATAMLASGYSGTEAVAFAANYMNYMCDNGSGSPYALASPCYVDMSGPWAAGGGATAAPVAGTDNLTASLLASKGPFTFTIPAAATDTVAVGYAAQPFIEEVAIQAEVPSGTTPKFTGSAVVLYNPYNVPLSLAGWTLRVLASGGATYDGTPVNLGTDFPSGIPANSYIAVTSTGATGETLVGPPGSTVPDANLVVNEGDIAVVLSRPFTYSGASASLPVDAFSTLGFNSVAAPTTPTWYYSDRYQAPAVGTVTNPWGCADAMQSAPQAADYVTPPLVPTAGTPPVPVNFAAIPLWDRFADRSDPFNTAYTTVGALPGYQTGTTNEPASAEALCNIADFDRITRLPSISSLVGGVWVPVLMTSQAMEELTTEPAITDPTVTLPYEANARFDFIQPTGTMPPDPRALNILKMITMTNQADNPAMSGNSATLDAIRMAGRLNVNTASLPALENLFVSVGDSSSADNLATLIVDCRDRIGTFINTGTNNPGSGICSTGQLLYALNDGSTAATTMDNRDWTWATIYNMATVRGDTFVVYGLIQALHLNGNYNGTLPTTANTTDWYTANQAGTSGSVAVPLISTDPDNTAAEYILEGQRRFVAIMDRSYCNLGPSTPGFQLPKVVALKVLPN